MAKRAPGRRSTAEPGDLEPSGGGRPMWKGAVAFGLVTMPVALHPATERASEISFRLLHEHDESRIELKRFCVAEDVEVPWGDIVKGYEYARGRHVVVTDEDFAKARVPATQTFEIRDFVPGRSIDDLYFEHPYYVTPDGRAAARPYALLREALEKTGRVGLGTIVLRQRERLAALEPAGDALVLTTMRWAHEIRSPARLGTPKVEIDKRELDLALRLVDALAAEFDPARYQDTYREVLLKVIEAKVRGEEVELPRAGRRRPVANLMKALEASLRERKAPAKARGRARARGRETRAA